MPDVPVAGSFRDPAGVVFERDGVLLRRVAPAGLAAYRQLVESGLYAALATDHLLIPHDDLGADPGQPGHHLLRPQRVPMISYPYEWSPSQLRDAAIVTLRAQRVALRFGMTLRDASAFNVQFVDGRPILIDTLSFGPYEGGPWLAYRQFCQHFYGPLQLAARRDARLMGLAARFVDGVPLDLASTLLPRTSYLRAGPLLHLHLHARAESAWGRKETAGKDGGTTSASPRTRGTPGTPGMPAAPEAPARDATGAMRARVEALVGSLERAVRATVWTQTSAWSGYYAERESYAADAFAHKVRTVTEWLARTRPRVVWDLGANTGRFSALAVDAGASVVAFDADIACVDALYREVQRGDRSGILPLVLDLTNPSPPIGWANTERMTLAARGPADLLLVLAVTHHLAIGNNVPLSAIAAYLATLGRRAIVEFVPKSDPMIQSMLRSRADVFDGYDEGAFQRAFGEVFHLDERVDLAPSSRALYLMTAR